MATKSTAPQDKVVTKAVPKDEVKVTVRSTPLVVKTTEPEPAKTELSVHHELTITPPKEEIDALISSVEPAAEPVAPALSETEPPKPVEEPTKTEAVATSTLEPAKIDETMAPKPPTPPVDDAPKTEPKSQTDLASNKTEEMQSPKVFDTKQYHLPIDEGVAHGKGKLLMILVVVLLLAAAAGAVAIDAGWIDAGFDLPFDLIK